MTELDIYLMGLDETSLKNLNTEKLAHTYGTDQRSAREAIRKTQDHRGFLREEWR